MINSKVVALEILYRIVYSNIFLNRSMVKKTRLKVVDIEKMSVTNDLSDLKCSIILFFPTNFNVECTE